MAGVLLLVLWALFMAVGLPLMIHSTQVKDRKGLGVLAAQLEDGRVSPATFWKVLTVEGRLDDRPVRVTFGGLLRYGVKVQHGLGHRVFDRQTLRERIDRIPPRSAQALEARSAIQHLIGRLGVQRFDLTPDGWLQVERASSSHALKPASLRQVLDQLLKLAPLFESRMARFKILGEREARAWTGGGQDVLCPFCRDTVAASADDLIACPACRTVHHAECFDEARGCTVFGCAESAAGQRVSA